MIEELVIKVPAPFSGIGDLGFSARYPAQQPGERLRDVPLFIEGPPRPMHRLVQRLALFVEKDQLLDEPGDDEAYTWTAPIQLSDEVCVMAFRDCSEAVAGDDSAALRSYLWNLVRPLAFTFLRDCVRIGGLRLAEQIAVILDPGRPPLVDLALERRAITADNGTLLLVS